MNQRRVVTGTRDGQELIVEDEAVEPIRVGQLGEDVELAFIFRAVGVPTVPNDGVGLPLPRGPEELPSTPGPGGMLVGSFKVPPGSALPPASSHPDDRRTESVDVHIVLEGEITFEGSDQSMTVLKQGDWIIKNGTGYRWHNQSSAPALVLAVICGARPTEDEP